MMWSNICYNSVKQINLIEVNIMTYIHTREGWLYIAVMIYLCSRKVVGWSTHKRITTKLVFDALQMALWRRRPSPCLIHRTDRGSQYASYAFR